METQKRDWKEEFAEKIFTIGATKEVLDAASKLKRDNIPRSLYKYRAVSKYSINNFTDDKIWFNSSSKMNDPYDSSLAIDQEGVIQGILKGEQYYEFVEETLDEYRKTNPSQKDWEDVEEQVRQLVTKGTNQMNKQFETGIAPLPSLLQEKTHISCFSEKNDSILMWSHYTNNHEGFCLEYDFTPYVEESDEFLEALNPIIYDNKIFDISDHLLDMYKNRTKIDRRVIRNAAVRKAEAWRYEEEWRILLLLELKDTGYEIGTFKPRAIYLGAKISEENKMTLMELAKEKRVDVYQMKLEKTEFKLVAKPEYIVSK